MAETQDFTAACFYRQRDQITKLTAQRDALLVSATLDRLWADWCLRDLDIDPYGDVKYRALQGYMRSLGWNGRERIAEFAGSIRSAAIALCPKETK
jgi:hypothetical protein